MTLMKDISAAAKRSQATLLHDFLGAAALGIMLIAALHLPTLS